MSANLTLRQLRAFEAVADEASFTRAAQRLSLTQSALSVLVREAERELGVALFDRHTRRVELTEAGQAFRPRVRCLLNDLASAVADLGDLRDKRRGVLRLAASQLIACTLVPQVLAAYRQQHPGVEIRLRDTQPERLLAHLQSGEVELLIGPDGELDQSGLHCHPVLEDRHWLVCRADDPLASRKRLAWPDLAGSAFIAPTRDFVARMRAELGVDCEPLLSQPWTETSYFTTAFGLVEAGLGVTLVPSYARPLVQAHGLSMRLIAGNTLTRRVSVYALAERQPSPAARAFVQCLDEVAQRRGFVPGVATRRRPALAPS